MAQRPHFLSGLFFRPPLSAVSEKASGDQPGRPIYGLIFLRHVRLKQRGNSLRFTLFHQKLHGTHKIDPPLGELAVQIFHKSVLLLFAAFIRLVGPRQDAVPAALRIVPQKYVGQRHIALKAALLIDA